MKGSAADMEESEDEELSGSPEAKQNKEKMRAAASAKQNQLLRFVGSDLVFETAESIRKSEFNWCSFVCVSDSSGGVQAF